MPDTTVDFAPGGYAYVPGVFQYSAGVRALPGRRIVRARFRRVVPLAEGFQRIGAFLDARGLARTAFAACELRSPAPFDEAGFARFNRAYVGVLRDWRIVADGANPVARSNVCPEIDPPAEPGFHAFCFAAPGDGAGPSFAVAGSGEVPEGMGNYRDHIVRPGDVSAAGLRAKAEYVVGEMARRMAAMGAGWADATAAQVYTVHDMHALMPALLVPAGAAAHGATWHFCRPPVVGLDFEMDCRGVAEEVVLEA